MKFSFSRAPESKIAMRTTAFSASERSRLSPSGRTKLAWRSVRSCMAGMAASKAWPRLLARWALRKDCLPVHDVTEKRKTIDSDVSLLGSLGGVVLGGRVVRALRRRNWS